MKYKRHKIFITMIVILLTGMLAMQDLIAASFGFSASTGAVNAGGSFSATVSVSGSGMFFFSANNGSVNPSSQYCDGSCSVTVTAGSSGTVTVTATAGAKGTANEVADRDDNPIEGSNSVSVAIKQANNNPGTSNTEKPTTPNTNTPTETPKETEKPKETDKKEDKEETKKSSDNTLSSLSVSKGTLSPKFNSATNVYTLNLTGDVTSIDVSAKAKDSKAIVSGTGKQTLKAGVNKLVISVTAENGSTKNYTINVSVDEKPQINVDYNGSKLGVVTNLDDVNGPNKQFEKTKVKLDGKDVQAWKNNLLNKTVVYLLDEKTGEKNYYVYNTSTNKIETIFKPIAILGHNFYIVDIDKNLQTRDGMKFGTVKIEKYELPGWTFTDTAFKNYSLIYVMNEKGDMAYYQYESTEKTLQLYSDAAPMTLKAHNEAIDKLESSIKTRNIIIGVLAGLSVILFILAFVFFFRKKKTTKYQKLDIQDKKFDNRFHIEVDALTQEDDEE